MQRQEKVFDFYIKGLHTTEISRQLGVGTRTIQRDIEEVKADLQKNEEIRRLRTWARADAEYADLWRECQMLLHSPALHDDPATKLKIIEAMRQIADSRNNLAFAMGKHTATEPNPTGLTKEEGVAAVVNLLPTELRNMVVESIRKNDELEKSP
jgi:hypothetical protein